MYTYIYIHAHTHTYMHMHMTVEYIFDIQNHLFCDAPQVPQLGPRIEELPGLPGHLMTHLVDTLS